MSSQTKSRTALRELIDTLTEIDERWAGPEWNLHSPEDVAGAHRALMHTLETALVGYFECDPAKPDFRRISTPTRKMLGDNGDAWYYDAPVSAQYAYVIEGSLHGAAYFSLTVEAESDEGVSAGKTAGVINDAQMEVEADGSFVLYLGGEERSGNWLPLEPGATRVTTRHYFETVEMIGIDARNAPPMHIAVAGESVPLPPPDDNRIAAGIRRVRDVLYQRTLGMPPMANGEQPAFVALTPNAFPPPVVPGDLGLAAFDAHYSMAPFFLAEDEALVIHGRWPDCVFANVAIWNRFQQTLDYTSRQVGLNRAQTAANDDGSFTIVIAHQDPGIPNWIDTEGNPFGLVFWRFFLVKGGVETPQAEVRKLVDVKAA
ncbi:MAG: DUF1214 domain-containing protein [Pseudomonadota bacterium]